MICFIDSFNLLNSNQSGFLSGLNTFEALIDFLDKVYDDINQNRVLLTIFLDFSKASDIIDHEILLKNCIYIVLEGKVWMGFALFYVIDLNLSILTTSVHVHWM